MESRFTSDPSLAEAEHWAKKRTAPPRETGADEGTRCAKCGHAQSAHSQDRCHWYFSSIKESCCCRSFAPVPVADGGGALTWEETRCPACGDTAPVCGQCGTRLLVYAEIAVLREAVERLTRERDLAREGVGLIAERIRADAAEAERNRLSEALREIADHVVQIAGKPWCRWCDTPMTEHFGRCPGVIAAALAREEGKK